MWKEIVSLWRELTAQRREERWEKIKPIIRHVLKNGKESSYKGTDIKQKSMVINGQTVVAPFVDLNRIQRVVTSWVKSHE